MNIESDEQILDEFAQVVAEIAHFTARHAKFDAKSRRITEYDDKLGFLTQNLLSQLDASLDQLTAGESGFHPRWFVSERMLDEVANHEYKGQSKDIIRKELLLNKRLNRRKSSNLMRSGQIRPITDTTAGLADGKKEGRKSFKYVIEHGYPRSLFAYDLVVANQESPNIEATKNILSNVFLVWMLSEEHTQLEKSMRDSTTLDTLLDSYAHPKHGETIKLIGLNDEV